MLIQVIVFGTIAALIIAAVVSWAGRSFHDARYTKDREQAFYIAEAGVEYYRWHLAHDEDDFQDGTGSAGPYVHNYYDTSGALLGTFSLTITPPLVGSTVVTITSTGSVASNPAITRTIETKLAKPSLAKYAMVTNSAVFYGSGDEVFGPIHSNVGVGFLSGSPQPIAHNLVTSAASTFDPGWGTKFGVFTEVPSADPSPPAAVPNRPDVFEAGRTFPVPAVSFTSLSADLAGIKASAQATGFYRAASGSQGYRIVLRTNDTFDLYRVNTQRSAGGGCNNALGQTGWGTWSYNSTTLLGNYAFPSNGLMFFEDHIWVEGQINGARLTIGAGTFPDNAATRKNIIVNENLTYTNFDGTDVIGLIAQGNFLVGMYSANSLTIHAAIIAQNGQTIRYYYSSPQCNPYAYRSTLTTYGMFASNGQGYFYYGSSGYTSQPASYDGNFLYSPPPSFPLSSDQYSTISWREL